MSDTYYKVIDGVKYDKAMLEFCDEAVAGAGDGRISKADAEKLLVLVKDGDKYTDVEKNTMKYIRDNYNWTDSADDWLRTEVRSWAAERGHASKDD